VTTNREKPYGARLSGPFFGAGFFWTGNTGSRSTGRQFAEQYNRARHYSTILSQWTTRDAHWPIELAYGYVNANPVRFVEPTGWDAERVPVRDPRPPLKLVDGGAGRRPSGPSRLVGGGAITGVGAAGTGTCFILVAGLVACYEICTYKVDKPAGPITWIGDKLGKCLAPWLGPIIFPSAYVTETVTTITQVPCSGKRPPRQKPNPEIFPGHPNYPRYLPEAPPRSGLGTQNCQKAGVTCEPKVFLSKPSERGHRSNLWLINGIGGYCEGAHTHIVFYAPVGPLCDCIESKRLDLECLGIIRL